MHEERRDLFLSHRARLDLPKLCAIALTTVIKLEIEPIPAWIWDAANQRGVLLRQEQLDLHQSTEISQIPFHTHAWLSLRPTLVDWERRAPKDPAGTDPHRPARIVSAERDLRRLRRPK